MLLHHMCSGNTAVKTFKVRCEVDIVLETGKVCRYSMQNICGYGQIHFSPLNSLTIRWRSLLSWNNLQCSSALPTALFIIDISYYCDISPYIAKILHLFNDFSSLVNSNGEKDYYLSNSQKNCVLYYGTWSQYRHSVPCMTIFGSMFVVTIPYIRPQVNWAVSLPTANGYFNLPQGFVWECMG